MNLALTVLEIVTPVFLLAALGFFWMKMGFDFPIQFITRMATTIAVPCLIFTALMQAQVDLSALVTQLTASTVAHILVAALSFAVLFIAGLSTRTYLAPMTFGNTGNLGLPLALFAFGQTGLELAVVILAISSILAFSIGIRMAAGKGSLLRILKEPMIWATLLGALFLWQGWQTPTFLTNTLSLAGQMAIPLMLITLGVAVAKLTFGNFATAFALSLIKLLICFAVGWGVGLAFGLTGVAFGVLVLQTATPVGVSAYLLAEKYGADSNAVAGFVVVSTLLSVAALPLILAALI